MTHDPYRDPRGPNSPSYGRDTHSGLLWATVAAATVAAIGLGFSVSGHSTSTTTANPPAVTAAPAPATGVPAPRPEETTGQPVPRAR